MKQLFSLLLFLSVATLGWSQCKEYKWPDADRAKAQEIYKAYAEAIKQQNYRGAVPGIQWFLNNAPDWNTKLYTDAENVYNKLASAEKDPARKQVLVDSLLWTYDARIKTCGDQVTVLNRKATYAAIYNGQSVEKTAEVLALFDQVLDVSGTSVSDMVLENYFGIVKNNVALLKNISKEDITARHAKIQAATDAKIAKYTAENKTAEAEKLKAAKASNDELLKKLVPAK